MEQEESVADTLAAAFADESTTADEAPEAKEVEEAPIEESADSEATQEEEAKAEEPEEEPKPIVLPHGWGNDYQEKFEQLPPELQEVVTKRESERNKHFTKQTQEAAGKLRENEELEQIFSQRQNQMALAGHSRAQHITQLGAMADFANSNPSAFVEWFQQQKGLQVAPKPEAEYVDPQVSALQNQLNQLTNHITAQQTNQAQAQTQNLTSQIQEFSSATNEQGVAKHPHFDTVRETMGVLISGGKASDMATAYDMAVRAHPELGEQLFTQRLEAEKAKLQSEAIGNAKKKANSARNAASSVTGSPGSGGEKDPIADDVRGELERLMNS